MKRRWKIFIVVALVLAVAVGCLWWNPTATGSSESLALPDGSFVRIVGVTYGTNHVAGSPLAKLLNRSPKGLQKFASRILPGTNLQIHSKVTTVPILVVWVERFDRGTNGPPSPASFVAYLSNEEGVCAGVENSVGRGVTALSFSMFPRRDSTLSLRIFSISGGPRPFRTFYPMIITTTSPTVGKVMAIGELRFSNPVRGSHPQWIPESLPAFRNAGDIEATLSHFSTGVDNDARRAALKGGRRKVTALRSEAGGFALAILQMRSLADSNQVWIPIRATISDATGNVARNTTSTRARFGSRTPDEMAVMFSFYPPLWPDEAAWKVDFELKQESGFPAADTFTFREVPIGLAGRTNGMGWATNFNGVSVAVDSFERAKPTLGRPLKESSFAEFDKSSLRISLTGLTNGVYLDLVSVRLDNGKELLPGFSVSGNSTRILPIPGIPQTTVTVDFTFAVHRSRHVQFLVKPELAPVDIELPSEP